MISQQNLREMSKALEKNESMVCFWHCPIHYTQFINMVWHNTSYYLNTVTFKIIMLKLTMHIIVMYMYVHVHQPKFHYLDYIILDYKPNNGL